MSGEYINPEVAVSPQKAFYAEKIAKYKRFRGMHQWRVCHVLPTGDSDSCPGGTDYKRDCGIYSVCKRKGCSMQGTEDPAVEYLQVLA